MIQIEDIIGSSNLSGCGFDPAQGILAVRFGSGSVYHYKEVPQEVYDAFLKSESKGKFHREHLLGKFLYEKVV